MSKLSQPFGGGDRRGGAIPSPASPNLVLVIVCAGVVLASLDLFIVNVALPQMAKDFGADGLGGLSWVLNAYAIVYAALLVLFGRFADRYNRKRGFLIGVGVFVAASAACAAATSLAMLIAFRVLQAAGAALLTPTSLGLILASFPPERRSGAVRTWTAVGGFAAALGPAVGGVLVDANWRWVFLVNVPIGLAALLAGWRLLPEVPGHPVRRPDALSALLITGGVGALTLGLVQGGSWGWGDDRTIAVLALAVVGLALFAAHTARHANPLIDRALFRVRPFTGASAVAVLFSMAFGAMLLSRVLWAQDVWHWSALTTGVSIVPGPIMVPVVSFLVAGRLIDRFGSAPVIAAGSTIFAAGMVWAALAAGLESDYVGDVLGSLVLTGIGVGLTLPTLMATAASSLPPTSFATGSAVVNMLRQVGLAIGVAVFIAVLGSPASAAATLGAYQRAWVVTAAISLAGGLVAIPLLMSRRRRTVEAPALATSS
ncbi:MAG TPA: DHA2 family efflux MFS transporter permease subunit [Solirubrobacteraceae bacterium]|nr:DHA2 family efflux MFS transporter permease subunit [Solirubrobacteraceae bacterium]